MAEHFASVSFDATASLDAAPKLTIPAAVAFDAAATLSPTATVEVAWASVSFTARAAFTPTIFPRGHKRRAVVTDAFGVPHGELERAKIGAITFELNDAGEEFSFVLPADDPKAPLVLDEKMREVQIWRGDQLLAWGPMVRPQVDTDWLAVTCRGALWHLTRRHIGKAERTNYIANGSFEDGLAHWHFGTSPVALFYNQPHAQPTPPLHEIVTFPVLDGRRALRLENYVPGADAQASQSFEWVVDADASPDGDVWTLKAYVYVESVDAPAIQGRGLWLERFSTTEPNPDPLTLAVDPDAKKSIERVFVPLDEDTPRGVWHRMEIGFQVPPKAGEPETISVQLYAPDGVVRWDAVSLTLDERLSFYGQDQTSVIAKGIVEHLQDAAYAKSDVNISAACQPSGVLRDQVYVHHEHPNGFRALEDLTKLANGFDFSMSYTPTGRTFTTHFPQRGRHLPRFALALGRNIADFAWTFDGERAASSVIVLGQGSGSDREEGAAIDPDAFAGGLTLEEVFSAPPGTPISSLDKLADERLISTTTAEVLAVKTTPPQEGQPDPIGVLWPGDTIPVRIRTSIGDIAVDDYRVQRLTVNSDDTLDLVLNRRGLTL